MKPLIAADELSALLADPQVVVIDCRHQLADPDWGRRVYAAGHIPGAHFMHLDQDLSGAKNGSNGRHPLPDAEVLAEKLGQMGIQRDSRIIAYDDVAGAPGAARLWWLLGWLGHAQVQVLNGGYAAWLDAGLPVSTQVPAPCAGHYRFDLQQQHLANVDEVVANLDQPAFLLVDARSAERFRGIGETLDPVGGHIPGAANRFFQHNLDAHGLFKPAETLRQEWTEALGKWPVDKVIHQCGSGVTACHNLLALAAAGLQGGRLYAGSWSEWCADPARPVARD